MTSTTIAFMSVTTERFAKNGFILGSTLRWKLNRRFVSKLR